MLSLSDAELSELMNLAAPLDVDLRDPFLRALAHELERYPAEALGRIRGPIVSEPSRFARLSKRAKRDASLTPKQ